MSTMLINAVMAIWLVALKHFMVRKHQLQVDHRNLVATSVALLDDMMQFSERYDTLINSELNQKKCQIYTTPSMVKDEAATVLPAAQRVWRPWSLGFNLPACDGSNDAHQDDMNKTKMIYDKALSSAHKARLLPHDVSQDQSSGISFCSTAQLWM